MSHLKALSIYGLLSFAHALPGASAAEYMLLPSPQTVHIGYFSAALKPVLTINSGDIATIETVGGPDPADVDASGVVPPSAVPEYVRAIRRKVTDRGPGPHILTGPVYINGAMPGDVLEVRILDIEFALPYGFNTQRPYTGALPEEFPGFFQRVIPIETQAKTATVAPGVVVPVPRPFFGVMGVAPLPAMGRISSGPPGVHTGNIDNKDVAAGTTLYMPVYAPGALYLEEAMKMAVRETILFITQRFPKLSREEAYMIASIAVDYRVTQVVDGSKGIHGMIPRAIFTTQ